MGSTAPDVPGSHATAAGHPGGGGHRKRPPGRPRLEALGDAGQQLAPILAAAMDGIVVFDGQGLIRALNPAAERLFGYPAGEVLGRDVTLLLPDTDHPGNIPGSARPRAAAGTAARSRCTERSARSYCPTGRATWGSRGATRPAAGARPRPTTPSRRTR